MSFPSQCHLWQADTLTTGDLLQALTAVETFVDEPHRTRDLRKGKVCGQLYFQEFLDWIDWVNGTPLSVRLSSRSGRRKRSARFCEPVISDCRPSRRAFWPITRRRQSFIASTG
jgi:hypothetical protein